MMFRTNPFRFSPHGSNLVKRSTSFLCVFTYAVLHSSLADPSRIKWYAMLWDFFLSIDSGTVVFASTDWLSPWMCDGPSQGIPIILSLYLKPLRYSQHCFIAMNSEPRDEDSTPVCFLLHQCVNAEFNKTKKPVLDQRVTISDAWSASTFARIWNPKPRGSGMFPGSSSFPSIWPNSLAVQSRCSNCDSSITGSLGSNTNSVL